MRRRDFIKVIAGSATVWPLPARAQRPAIPVIGFLRDSTEAGSGFVVRAMRKGLAEAGFVEGDNVTIDYAYSEGHTERLAALAAGLELL